MHIRYGGILSHVLIFAVIRIQSMLVGMSPWAHTCLTFNSQTCWFTRYLAALSGHPFIGLKKGIWGVRKPLSARFLPSPKYWSTCILKNRALLIFDLKNFIRTQYGSWHQVHLPNPPLQHESWVVKSYLVATWKQWYVWEG